MLFIRYVNVWFYCEYFLKFCIIIEKKIIFISCGININNNDGLLRIIIFIFKNKLEVEKNLGKMRDYWNEYFICFFISLLDWKIIIL